MIRRYIGDKVMRPLCERLAKRLSGSSFVGFDGNTILHRYNLLKIGPFELRLHHIVGKDPDPELFHDHPWSWSMAIVLAGSYLETMPNPWARDPEVQNQEKDSTYLFRPLSFNPILHDTFHHLTELPDGDAWTLYIHGPRIKADGFMRRNGLTWVFYRMTPDSEYEHVEPLGKTA